MRTPLTLASGALRALLGGDGGGDRTAVTVAADPAAVAIAAGVAEAAHRPAPAATPLADAAYDLLFDAWSGVAGDGIEPRRLDTRAPHAPATPLLPAGVWAGMARPSPCGARIAAVGVLDGVPGVYVLRAGDGRVARLALGLDPMRVSELTWSPDGERLAFRYAPTSADADVWVADADGRGTPANLTADLGPIGQGWPAWSPTLADGGSRIAFVHRAHAQERIWTMRPDGSDKRQLTAQPGCFDLQPAWSPDGTTIVFQRSGALLFGDLWEVPAAGGVERPLLPTPLPGVQTAPAWSPDGRLVAFASLHETAPHLPAVAQIYSVLADGTGLVRWTSDRMEKGNPGWIGR